MARRRSYRRSRSSYSRPRRSYSTRAPRRRRSSSRSGQTIRLVLQQPGAARVRPPFGAFQPTALYSPFMQPYIGQGAPWPQQGGPGVPGARMVINPVQAPGAPGTSAPGTPDGGGAT